MNAEIPDLRPIATLAAALLFGGLLGYIAQGALEPQIHPAYRTLGYSATGEGFPDTFASREAAIDWLEAQITFLEQNSTKRQMPVVERMKEQLASANQNSEKRIERSLFLHVREELELCRRALAGNPATPRTPPAIARPKMDE